MYPITNNTTIMNKITQKQLDKINSECKNGFIFDIQGFVNSGDKFLSKYITLEENRKKVEVSLNWKQGREPSGNIRVVPSLRVSVWNKPSDSRGWLSIGFGNRHTFTEFPSTRKVLKDLCKVTEYITDELICSLLPPGEQEDYRRLSCEEAK